jgi:large conductance mechanosensitive channel
MGAPRAILARARQSCRRRAEEGTMGFATEFREFASKGNVVDLAVGVIIGAAFAKIVDSLVKDLIMPVVGRIFGSLDFSNYFIVLAPPPPNYSGPMTYEALTKAGVPLFAYGNFITVLINFLILAFIIFVMIRQINRLRRAAAVVTVTPEDILLLREIRDSVKR